MSNVIIQAKDVTKTFMISGGFFQGKRPYEQGLDSLSLIHISEPTRPY